MFQIVTSQPQYGVGSTKGFISGGIMSRWRHSISSIANV